MKTEIKEELVSFDTAKLAKEKGFNVPTTKNYELSLTEQVHDEDGKTGPFGWEKDELITQSGYFINNHPDIDFSNKSWYMCSRPTQSLLQTWLREVHNVDVSPHIIRLDDEINAFIYYPTILTPNKGMSWESIWEGTYEQALEKGLQEALKLIK